MTVGVLATCLTQ